MHASISFNGEIASADHATLSPLSSAALYGKGVFTTISVHAGKPFLWHKHWRRLLQNATALNIDVSALTQEILEAALAGLIEYNRLVDGRARITVFDEGPSPVWPAVLLPKVSFVIMTGEKRPIPQDLKVGVSAFEVNSRSPVTGVKSCNYLENLIALERIKTNGFDEAIRLNELQQVVGGCMSNVFWLKGDVLYTPSLATGCLAGTTRELVLDHLECREVEVGINSLNSADAVFLTSAGFGIKEIADLEGRNFERSGHTILNLWPDHY